MSAPNHIVVNRGTLLLTSLCLTGVHRVFLHNTDTLMYQTGVGYRNSGISPYRDGWKSVQNTIDVCRQLSSYEIVVAIIRACHLS